MTRTEQLTAIFSGDANGLKTAAKQGENALRSLDKTASVSTASVLKSFGSLKVGALAAAGVLAGLGAAAKKALDAADALGKSARAAGLGVESYQRLAHAFGLAGIEGNEFDSAMRKLSVNLGKAAAGSKNQVDVMNALGVTSTDTNVAVGQIAEGLARIQDPAERSRLAAAALGEELGPRMVDALSGGKAALDEVGATLGSTLSTEQVATAERLNDRLEVLAKTVGNSLKSAFLDAVKAAESWLTAMGNIEAQTSEQVAGRIQRIDENLSDLNKTLRDSMDIQKLGGPVSDQQLADIQAQILKLQLERDKLEAGAVKRMTDNPRVGPNGEVSMPTNASGGVGSSPYGPTAPPAFKAGAGSKAAAKSEADRADEQFRREQAAARERYIEDEKRRRDEKVAAAEWETVRAREAEMEALERQQEALKDFATETSATLADMAIQGGSAADELKRRVLQALIQMSVNSITGGSGPNLGSALKLVGSIAGAFGGGGGADYSSFVSATANATGFASGGSFKVGGSGGTDSKRISFDATPGELVEIRRPGGTGGTGSAPKVEQYVNVNVETPPGMTASQQRTRDASGRETIRLVVREAMQREAAQRTGGANAILDDSGSRRAPRPGID